jgi:hypothetical protein
MTAGVAVIEIVDVRGAFLVAVLVISHSALLVAAKHAGE